MVLRLYFLMVLGDWNANCSVCQQVRMKQNFQPPILIGYFQKFQKLPRHTGQRVNHAARQLNKIKDHAA